VLAAILGFFAVRLIADAADGNAADGSAVAAVVTAQIPSAAMSAGR